jgi:hypothetical protein
LTEKKVEAEEPAFVQTSLQLWMFKEEKKLQYLKKSYAMQYGFVALVFNKAVQKLDFKSINMKLEESWAFREYSEERDTVKIWLPRQREDTLIMDFHADTLRDTTEIPLLQKGEVLSSGGKRSKVEKKKFELKLSAPNKSKVQHPNKPFEVRFSHPVVYSELELITLTEDSVKVDFKPSSEHTAARSLLVNYKWKPDKNYKLFIAPGSFTDLFELKNDTFETEFKGGAADNYGTIILKVKTPEQGKQYLIQLLDSKQAVLEEKTIKKSAELKFTYLLPGNYSFKVIFDTNANGKWDTGNYLTHTQAETINFYEEKKMNVRANWDLEIEWGIEAPK